MNDSPKKMKYVRLVVLCFLVLIMIAMLFKYKKAPHVKLKISVSTQNLVDRNYLKYSKLSYVSFEDEDRVLHEFRNAIAKQKTGELTELLKNNLADLLAEVLLSKGAGDFERYKKCVQLKPNMIPFDKVKYFFQTWYKKSPPANINAYELAKQMFNLEVHHNGGKHLPAACSFEETAIRMKSIRVHDLNDFDTTEGLSDDESDYWFGPIANSAYHFFVPDVPLEAVVQNHGSVLWVDFMIIVKTVDNDMYPLRVRLWYHPDLSKWIIHRVTRQSTIKGAMYSPAFVF